MGWGVPSGHGPTAVSPLPPAGPSSCNKEQGMGRKLFASLAVGLGFAWGAVALVPAWAQNPGGQGEGQGQGQGGADRGKAGAQSAQGNDQGSDDPTQKI